jgi:hypothetical protein
VTTVKINTTGTTNPVSIDLDLSEYEKEVLRAIKLARDIQDFIWAEESWANKPFDPQTWAPVFQKRVDCLMEIKTDQHHGKSSPESVFCSKPLSRSRQSWHSRTQRLRSLEKRSAPGRYDRTDQWDKVAPGS